MLNDHNTTAAGSDLPPGALKTAARRKSRTNTHAGATASRDAVQVPAINDDHDRAVRPKRSGDLDFKDEVMPGAGQSLEDLPMSEGDSKPEPDQDHTLAASQVFPQAAVAPVKADPQKPRSRIAASLQVLPVIDVTHVDLARRTEEAVQALLAKNNPPLVYRYGSGLARIVGERDGRPLIQPLDHDRLRHHLARVATWRRATSKSIRLVAPPTEIVRDVLASPELSLPLLRRVVPTPVFDEQGRLVLTPGYDAASGIYVHCPPGVEWLPVPVEPSDAEVARALRLFDEDLFVDFPLIGPSDRATALAFALLPIVRSLILGPTPLHLFRKPTARTGATLLVELIHIIHTGARLPVLTLPATEEERRRTLTARLDDAPLYLVFDNATELDSPALSGAITGTRWVDRIVGSSRTVDVPIACGWGATGNNPRLSKELAARSAVCGLDARMERPEERTSFKYPRITEWLFGNRLKFVQALHILGQRWIAVGQPLGSRTLGGFEGYSGVIGGMLEAAGVSGFLAHVRASQEATDTETPALRELFTRWWLTHGGRSVGVSEVYPVIDTPYPLLLGLEKGKGGTDLTEVGRKMALASLLNKLRDRVIGGFRLGVAGTLHHALQWRLEEVNLHERSEAGAP